MDFQNSFNPVFLVSSVTIVTTGLICNFVLLISIQRRADQRCAPTYTILTSLSLADICLLLSGICDIYVVIGRNLTDTLCKVMTYVVYTTASSSVYHLLAFSVFRFFILTRPLCARIHITFRLTLIVCSLIWVVSHGIAAAIFQSASSVTKIVGNSTMPICTMDGIFQQVYAPFICISIIVPVLLAVGFHIAKSFKLSKKAVFNGNAVLAARRSVSGRAVIAISVTFTLCWLPTPVGYLVSYVFDVDTESSFILSRTATSLIYLNSAINPILYFLFSKIKQRKRHLYNKRTVEAS